MVKFFVPLPPFASARSNLLPVGMFGSATVSLRLPSSAGSVSSKIDTTLTYSGMSGGTVRPECCFWGCSLSAALGYCSISMLACSARVTRVRAYSSHSCLGYSASSAVENCWVTVSKPQARCSCIPSHCLQKLRKTALFVRKLVLLYLAPP